MSIENYGSYQLLKRLATGGMAQIYLARERGPEGFEKHLVVKRILPHLAENVEFVQMFLDEARIAARLNHSNVVQIFRLGHEEGGAEGRSYFIAMEYIHGEDVRRVWKRAEAAGKSMPIALVCRVIMDACSGLDYAHKLTDQGGKPLGIVHRDISPQNILVTFEGGVKVVDFGIAKAADQATVTKSGVLKGKYSYMSPEQASGQKLDCRSDIFALGVVLHELLTGQRLFKRANDIQTLHAVTECEVPLPSQVNPRLPKDLDPVVMKALAKDPRDRYPDAISLQLALEHYLLQHQMPSSATHLAAFMQELYAERLAEERRAGRLLVEELDAARLDEADANLISGPTPMSRRSKSPALTGERSPPSRAAQARLTERHLPAVGGGVGMDAPSGTGSNTDNESTTAERLSSKVSPMGRTREPVFEGLIASARDGSGARRPGALLETLADGNQTLSESAAESSVVTTHTTDISGPSRRGPLRKKFPLLAVVIGASSALVLAGGTFVLARRGRAVPAPAPTVSRAAPTVLRAQLVSSPSGASVTVDGAVHPETTPATLELTPGPHTLVLTHAGYREMSIPVQVPDQGPLALPVAVLEQEAPEQVDAGTSAALAAVPTRVHVTFRSEPPASLTVDGKARGRTPVTLTLEPDTEVAVRLERAGYQSLTETVTAGKADKEQVFVLDRAAKGHPARFDPESAAPRASGKVRFAVTPWANVSCGSHELGQTPLPDVELPVGSYECKFTNPDSGTRTEHVEVRANAVSRVSIKF